MYQRNGQSDCIQLYVEFFNFQHVIIEFFDSNKVIVFVGIITTNTRGEVRGSTEINRLRGKANYVAWKWLKSE